MSYYHEIYNMELVGTAEQVQETFAIMDRVMELLLFDGWCQSQTNAFELIDNATKECDRWIAIKPRVDNTNLMTLLNELK